MDHVQGMLSLRIQREGATSVGQSREDGTCDSLSPAIIAGSRANGQRVSEFEK